MPKLNPHLVSPEPRSPEASNPIQGTLTESPDAIVEVPTEFLGAFKLDLQKASGPKDSFGSARNHTILLSFRLKLPGEVLWW